jgi:hypothetical protein
MKPQEIAWRRLAGQFLTVPGPGDAAGVVRALGAVQAQDYAGAKWALGQRIRGGATDAEVERAIDAGAIVRTHVLRPTWHLVAPEDIRWMLALTAPRISRALSYYNVRLGLTPAVLRRGNAVIARALEGGRALTRAELSAALERARIPVGGSHRLGRVLVQAELDALVCSGPRRGKQSTHALLDERVPGAGRVLDRDEALGELARRYFPTRGPATARDFAWWAGLTLADARRAIEVAGRRLARVEIDGAPYWMAAAADTPPRRARAHLLPNYDEYFIGLVDRGAIGARLGHVGSVTGGNGLIGHVVTVNGQLVGVWRRTGDGLRLDLAARLSPVERRLVAREVRRLGAFL